MSSHLTITFDGTRVWKDDKGLYHREDGPAVECISGYKAWYSDGQLHRTDGPALEHPSGTKCWYINGLKIMTQYPPGHIRTESIAIHDLKDLESYAQAILNFLEPVSYV